MSDGGSFMFFELYGRFVLWLCIFFGKVYECTSLIGGNDVQLFF